MQGQSKLRESVSAGVQRVQAAGRGLVARLRQHPRLVVAAAVVVGLGALAAIGVAAGWHREAVELVETSGPFVKPTLAELQRKAKQSPKDASLQRDLGHAYFASGSRTSGLRAYGRALALDPKVADDTLVHDVLACFGRHEQGAAATFLGKHRLTEAAPRLSALARDRRPSVRSDAIHALTEMGKATRGDYIAAYLLDLELADCDARRRAVDRLAAYADRNDKQVLSALRAAAKKDSDQTPWYKSSCLGGSTENAEKRILARR